MTKYSIILNDTTTLTDVVAAIDKGGIGFLALTDSEANLLGIVTDGDLRRSILKNTSNLTDIINFTPVTMKYDSKRSQIIEKLRTVHRRHMPLVDGDKLVSVFVLDEPESCSYDNYVVVMAGGLGSRLGELTKETPKPMLKIGDRPILQHLVEQFRDQGFSKFIFCLNYKKEVIVEHFGDGKKFGVLIDYVVENERLGTAGALSLLRNYELTHPFFVINADVLTTLDFKALLDSHVSNSTIATMCVRTHDFTIPYGVVVTDSYNTIVDISEKPTHSYNVNAGIYVLDKNTLPFVPDNTFYDMPTLFSNLAKQGISTKIYQMNDYWVDIGKKEDLLKANQDISIGNN